MGTSEQHTSCSLSQLALSARGGRDPQITGIAVDSRDVEDGYLFAALPGSRVHGGEFIQYALRMGAAAILTDAEGAAIAETELAASSAALVVTEDPRQALAFTSALWVWRPARENGGGHGYKRQNLGGNLCSPNLGRTWPSCG